MTRYHTHPNDPETPEYDGPVCPGCGEALAAENAELCFACEVKRENEEAEAEGSLLAARGCTLPTGRILIGRGVDEQLFGWLWERYRTSSGRVRTRQVKIYPLDGTEAKRLAAMMMDSEDRGSVLAYFLKLAGL